MLSEAITGKKGWEKNAPQLFVNLLQGSKLVGSKCKIFKAYLIIKQDPSKSLLDLITALTTVAAQIRKNITAGKLGEAALKPYSDGSYICPADTINDNIKLMDDAINQVNLKGAVTIGLSFQGDLLYNPDQKKYELENPKQLLDENQLIDYYTKLCTDKPVISMLEDPLIPDSLEGWQKLKDKTAALNVQLGTRKLATLKKFIEKPLPILDHFWCRPTEFQTFTDFADVLALIAEKMPKLRPIICDSSVENSNTFVTDLAVHPFFYHFGFVF